MTASNKIDRLRSKLQSIAGRKDLMFAECSDAEAILQTASEALKEIETMSNCELCGEPMPKGEEMFKYHGSSGPCPKPPLPTQEDDGPKVAFNTFRGGFRKDTPCPVPHWDDAPAWVRDAVKVAYMAGKLNADVR